MRPKPVTHRVPAFPAGPALEPMGTVFLAAAVVSVRPHWHSWHMNISGQGLGDVDCGTASVIVGDAWDLIPNLGDASVDCVVTSPPYWGLRDYGLRHEDAVLSRWIDSGHDASEIPDYEWYRDNGGVLGLEPYPEWYVAHLVQFMARIRGVLKPKGSVWLNLGDTYFARWGSIRADGRQGLGSDARARRRTPAGGYRQDKQLLLIPARVAIAMQDSSWILRNDLIWAKPDPMPRPEKDRLRLSHEHFFHFVPKPRQGRASYYYDLAEVEPGALDVVSVRTSAGTDGHSATFPVDLIRPRIESSCPPGGLVLDPFAGTGRTLVESLRLGRRGVGFEMSDRYGAAAQANVRAAIRAVRAS